MNDCLTNLTLTDLETLIETIVKRTLKQEITNRQKDSSQSFLETFDTWQDDQSDEEIIHQIYSSRNSNINE